MTDLFGTLVEPKNQQEWSQLDFLVRQLFTPHAPIDEAQLFAGRWPIVELVSDAVFQKGQHAIMFGERGVGKTSLTNMIATKVLSESVRYKVTRRNCTSGLTFSSLWRQLFDDMETTDGKPLASLLGANPGAYEVKRCIDCFHPNTMPLFVIDEYDRIKDPETHIKMADTIKYLSDESVDSTLIIVGVAESVAQLFGGHESIERAVRQIPMPLMSPNELHLIFETRLRELGMAMDEPVQEFIVKMAHGLPGFVHLLGQNACRVAIARKSLSVESCDVYKAMKRSIETCDERIKSMYADAVRSTKPNNLYRQGLLACALADFDGRGYFSAGDVLKRFSQVMKTGRTFTSIARHLNEFCSESRGEVLLQVGAQGSYEYKFAAALLRPFVIMNGVEEHLIDPEDL